MARAGAAGATRAHATTRTAGARGPARGPGAPPCVCAGAQAGPCLAHRRGILDGPGAVEKELFRPASGADSAAGGEPT